MKTEIVESEQLQGAKALKLNKRQRLWKDIKAAKYLYMLIVPVMIYILIFRYGPMYGKWYHANKAALDNFSKGYNAYKDALLENSILPEE